MKRFKSLVMIALVVCLISGMVTVGWTAPKKIGGTKPTTGLSAPTTQPLIKCPTGWKTMVGNNLFCVPISPTPIQCPSGYEYREKLSCSADFGGGASGCVVGCYPVPN